jgi:alcohol dehydrogenase class IV
MDYLHAVTYRLSIPRLGSYGLEKEDLQEIVNQSDIKNNPVKLADDHLTEILNDRL